MDGLTLCDNTYKSGAVFLLSKTVHSHHEDFYSKKIGIWQVVVKDEGKLLVVKTKRQIKRENIYNYTFDIAQKFLDFISVEIRNFNTIKNYQNFLLWYVEGNKNILETVSRSAITISSRTKLTIKPVDKRKKERVVKNNLTEHHPALRYFRISRSNNDFIDAFRNQYLAFEQLLSSIRPKTCREWVWISTTLNLSTKKAEMAKILKCQQSRLADEFKIKIYNVRNALFHAKKGERYYLPGDLITKGEIIESLQTLEYINWILLDEHYNTRIARGGMVIGGLQGIANNFCRKEQQFKMLVSNRSAELDEKGKLDDETKVPHLITDAQSEVQDRTARVYTEFKVKDILKKFNKLSRTGVIGSGGLYEISQFEKPIELSNIVALLRVNQYTDITSDDFHQFYY